MKGLHYLYVSGAIVLAIGIVGGYYDYLILDEPQKIQKFSTKTFEVTLTASNQNNKINGVVMVTDILQYDMRIKNKMSEYLLIKHNVLVIQNLESVYESKIITRTIQPRDSVEIIVEIPMKEVGNHLVRHNFSSYLDKQKDKVLDGMFVDYKPLVHSRTDYITLAQISTIIKYAWILAIPLVLGSVKVIRGFIED